jgi:hypothetical protein
MTMPRPMPSLTSRRGFLLVELLLTLILLAAFAAIATPVLRWSIRTLVAPPPAAVAGRLDAAVGSLRRDVWGAVNLAAPSPHELQLTTADGRTVRWHVGPGELLQRGEQHWSGLFPDAAVAIDGAAVRLTLADRPGFRGGVTVLPSEATLIGRDTQ